MAGLVIELRREHDAIRTRVAAIKQCGVMTEEGFAGLQLLGELLLKHIGHEDQVLYPRLEKAAQHDENLRVLLERFREEMNEITFEALRFFDLYKTPSKSIDFAHDVARIFSMIANRIITEESVLYPRLSAIKQLRHDQ